MKPVPFWLDDMYSGRKALSGNVEADVVVVGAGITGVATAYFCARQGLRTILVEKNTIASGSAGRNGGMIVEGLHGDFLTATQRFGPDAAKARWLHTIEARKIVQTLIQDNHIECKLEQPGSLCLAQTEEEDSLLRQEAAARQAAGIGCQLIEPGTQLHASPLGLGLYNPDDCTLHPVKFVRGLAEVAENKGLQIYENSPALNFDVHRVVTPKGVITADKVVVALESAGPRSDQKTHIVCEQAIVTEPLLEQQLEGLDWRIGGMFWTMGEDYYNIRKIGTRLFISHVINLDPTEEQLRVHREHLIDVMTHRLPTLKKQDLRISHYWTALVLRVSRDWPYIDSSTGYYQLFGNGDFGFTNGIMLGKVLAESFVARSYQNYINKGSVV